MRTIATDTAVAHANTLPIPFQLQCLFQSIYAHVYTTQTQPHTQRDPECSATAQTTQIPPPLPPVGNVHWTPVQPEHWVA